MRSKAHSGCATREGRYCDRQLQTWCARQHSRLAVDLEIQIELYRRRLRELRRLQADETDELQMERRGQTCHAIGRR